VVAIHEPLRQQPPLALGHVERPLDFCRPAAERLLAQDVLAGLERAQSPLDVQRIGKRDVDGLDVGVGQQRVVAAIRPFDPLIARVSLGPRLVSAGDREDRGAVRFARTPEETGD
jgi:hypothetical protein